MMFGLGVLFTLYVMIALIAASMTYCEQQQQSRKRNIILRVLGYLACVIWPLTLATVALAGSQSQLKSAS